MLHLVTQLASSLSRHFCLNKAFLLRTAAVGPARLHKAKLRLATILSSQPGRPRSEHTTAARPLLDLRLDLDAHPGGYEFVSFSAPPNTSYAPFNSASIDCIFHCNRHPFCTPSRLRRTMGYKSSRYTSAELE